MREKKREEDMFIAEGGIVVLQSSGRRNRVKEIRERKKERVRKKERERLLPWFGKVEDIVILSGS